MLRSEVGMMRSDSSAEEENSGFREVTECFYCCRATDWTVMTDSCCSSENMARCSRGMYE